MRGRTVRTPEKGDKLLDKLRLGYSVRAACRAENIGYRTYYDWRRDDPTFAVAADSAIDEGTDYLEDKARDRAVKDSDTLMIFLLKARRPDKYRERTDVHHSGDIGATVTVVFSERSDGPQ